MAFKYNATVAQRVLQEAMYYVQHQTTIRETAKKFNSSRTTLHNDLTKKLPVIHYTLYLEVRELIGKNTVERARRGGKASRRTGRK